MKNFHKILIGVAIVLVVVVGMFFVLTANNHSQPVVTSSIRVGYLPTVQSLPWYLAIEKGYFKDARIDVDFESFNAPNQIIDALVQGRIDFTGTSAALGIIGTAESKGLGQWRSMR